MDIKDFKDPKVKVFVWTLASVLILIVVFLSGVYVGSERARFSNKLGERYYRDFIGGNHRFVDRNYLNAHGVSGKITQINGNSLVVNDNGINKNIMFSDQTIFRKNFQNIAASDLKVADQIIVIGAPNDQGDIIAKFIKVQP